MYNRTIVTGRAPDGTENLGLRETNENIKLPRIAAAVLACFVRSRQGG